MRKIVYFLFLSVLIMSQINAQPTGRNVSKAGTSAATFLQIPVGARAIGMGGAFVAIADDITSFYWNPAGSSRLDKREVTFNHIDWIADITYDYAAVAVPLPQFGTLGLSFTSMNMDDMMVRTVENPDGTGEMFSSGSIAIGVHYSRNLTDRFSIGFSAKYISERIWDMTAQGFAVDFGTLFITDFLNGMRIGAALTNFGTELQMSGRNTRTHGRIDDRKEGSADRVPFHIEMDSWPMPLGFQFGIATDAFRTEQHVLTVAVDALHPSNNFQSVNTGLEYGFNQTIFFRGGYQSLFLPESEGGLTMGAGLQANMFGDIISKIDYSYRDFGRLRAIHVFNVSVLF